MLGRKRATRPDLKDERRQALLDAAWALFQATSYSALTMADVAERTGLAKGTTYLYFGTKEALMLAVLEQQLLAWFAAINADLAALGPSTAAAVAQTVAASLETQPAFRRLLAILHTLLEHNIDHDTALRFKRMLLEHTLITGASFERALAFLTAGQGAQLLIRIHALAIGLQHVADPAPVVRAVLAANDLQVFDIQFSDEFEPTLRALLLGLHSEAQP